MKKTASLADSLSECLGEGSHCCQFKVCHESFIFFPHQITLSTDPSNILEQFNIGIPCFVLHEGIDARDGTFSKRHSNDVDLTELLRRHGKVSVHKDFTRSCKKIHSSIACKDNDPRSCMLPIVENHKRFVSQSHKVLWDVKIMQIAWFGAASVIPLTSSPMMTRELSLVPEARTRIAFRASAHSMSTWSGGWQCSFPGAGSLLFRSVDNVPMHSEEKWEIWMNEWLHKMFRPYMQGRHNFVLFKF